MDRRALYVGSAFVALALAGLPAIAQTDQNSQNTQTNQNTGRRHRNRDMNAQNGAYNQTYVADDNETTDLTVPQPPSLGELRALRRMAAAGITDSDILAALPLMQDLLAAQNHYYGHYSHDVYTLLSASDLNGRATNADLDSARDRFRARRDDIWNAVRQKIGDQKASVLESLVEPRPMTYNTAYTSPGLTQIDTTLAEWDRLEQTRLASTGQTAPSTTTTTASTTTVTTTVAPAVPISIYSFPPLSVRELVTLMQDRIAFVNGTDETALQLRPGEMLTAERLSSFQQRQLNYWR